MKLFLIAAAIAAAAITTSALAADVGISLSMGQPGFYGQLDIGGYAQPQVVYRQPMMIEPVPVDRPPIYLHVPPGYASHWRLHCREYNACGERVFFVRNNWYSREYVPHYHEHRRDHRDEYREDHGHVRDH